MPNPASRPGLAATFTYPTNENGDPEYASVIITLDHLSAGREGNPHVNNKFVFSTEDEAEALFALLGYYGETSISTNPAFAKMVGEVFGKDYPVFVYTTTKNVEIILAMDTFLMAINADTFGGGSVLMTVERLVNMVNRIIIDKLDGYPEGVRLAPFGFELEEVEAPAEEPAPVEQV